MLATQTTGRTISERFWLCYGYSLIFSALLIAKAHGETGVFVDPTRIVKQTDNADSCVAAAILNALQFGNERLQTAYKRIPGQTNEQKATFILKKYGSRDSNVVPGFKAYISNRGVTAEDTSMIVNALLRDSDISTVNATFADRLGSETTLTYVRRIHGLFQHSLEKRVPVIASVKSYAAHPARESAEPEWSGLHGHTIVVTGVTMPLLSYQKGFAFEFVDSLNGTIEQGYAYAEDARKFAAVRKVGSEYQWATGSPFLLLILPSLPLGTERQQLTVRTLLHLNYLIGDFGIAMKD